MAFCEQCGAELSAGVRFCEECGSPVDYDESSSSVLFGDDDSPSQFHLNLFNASDWKVRWEEAAESVGDCELGLIITRENALISQLEGAGADRFHKELCEYIAKAEDRGIKYYYCDFDACAFHDGDGTVESVVASLRKIVEVARPKYLFILGNEDVIDVARWENQTGDGDETVESDLCYSTLDVCTPWDGQQYNFDEVMRVGRLPSHDGETLYSYCRYFESAKRYIGTIDVVRSYGLSALVWEEESNDEYKEISRDKVDVSPEVTNDDVHSRICDDTNLLFFNLHGSDDTEFWYGQEDSSYPEAFSPTILENRERPYFLGVEACYGARYLDGLSDEESIMMTALRNNCLAFLGSSKIAFGTSRPKGSCADIVVGDYVKYLAKGFSAGDAYVEGLRRLDSDSDDMDDSDIKTLAEFALYGDPSATMGCNKRKCGNKGLFKSTRIAKGLPVPMPDVRRCVQMALAEVDAKIEAIVDDFVVRNLMPELRDLGLGAAKQSIFKMKNTGLNQKIYSLGSGTIRKVAKVYFDDNGRIRKALTSK